jgi:hypothetical protein
LEQLVSRLVPSYQFQLRRDNSSRSIFLSGQSRCDAKERCTEKLFWQEILFCPREKACAALVVAKNWNRQMPSKISNLTQLQTYVTNILSSPAPDALKAAVRPLLGDVITDDHAAAEVATTEILADAVFALPGASAAHLDLIQLLQGRCVRVKGHRRANLAAVLRSKARALGHPPVASDFPVDHPIHVLALAYWGGVAAWSAGSPSRTQQPKGYWTDRQNQITALRAAVARHPEIPVTHALLQRAGFHRLALMLNAEELVRLADEAGVDRKLLTKANGWWTCDRVIDAYADQCRAAGVTLSSSALAAIGGEASSLRAYLKRHFGKFRAFQDAVTARHRDIRPPSRPTATDGTYLDSWSEVVAYQAIREALPNVMIETHVALPGEPLRSPRSGDFLLDGQVWVEVLGLSRTEMTTATANRQKKYARQWIAKLARYTALGVAPIVIEPADLHDPRRLTDRVSEIARHFGLPQLPVPPGLSRSIRAKGTWNFDTLCKAVAEVAATSGTLPTYAALTAAGYGHAAQLLRQPGERQRVATALGLHVTHCKGIWTQQRVVEEVANWVQANGSFPTQEQLKQAGLGPLRSAIARLWRGDSAGLYAAVEKRIGRSLPPQRAPNGSLATQAQLMAALRPLAETLGRMPTGKEASDAGLCTAWTRTSGSIGVASMAKLLGVPSVGPRHRSHNEMLREFADVAVSVSPRRLTTPMIRAALGSGGIARIRKCGGIASVRAQIGRKSDAA